LLVSVHGWHLCDMVAWATETVEVLGPSTRTFISPCILKEKATFTPQSLIYTRDMVALWATRFTKYWWTWTSINSTLQHHHPLNKQAIICILIHRAGDLCDDESCQDELQPFKAHSRRIDEPETDLLCCPSTIQGHSALTGSHLSHRPFIYTTFNISLAYHLKGSVRELEGLYTTFKSYTKSSEVQLSVWG